MCTQSSTSNHCTIFVLGFRTTEVLHFKYCSLAELVSNPHKPESERRSICMLGTLPLQSAKSMLAAIEANYGAPQLHVDVLKK